MERDYDEGRLTTEPSAKRKRPGNWKADEWIREDIMQALIETPDVDVNQIKVEVKEGMVFLNGSVRSLQMKEIIQKRIASVQGITEIHNDLNTTK